MLGCDNKICPQGHRLKDLVKLAAASPNGSVAGNTVASGPDSLRLSSAAGFENW